MYVPDHIPEPPALYPRDTLACMFPMRSSVECSMDSGICPYLSPPLPCSASPLGLGFNLLTHICTPPTHLILSGRLPSRMVSLASSCFTLALDSELRPCTAMSGPSVHKQGLLCPSTWLIAQPSRSLLSREGAWTERPPSLPLAS